MKIPSAPVNEEYPVVFHFLSQQDIERDIRRYVASVIRDVVSADQTIQEDLIDQILAKASGSFPLGTAGLGVTSTKLAYTRGYPGGSHGVTKRDASTAWADERRATCATSKDCTIGQEDLDLNQL